MQNHVEEQRRILMKLVEKINIQPASDNESDENVSSAMNDEEAAGNLVRHIDRLQGQWQVLY
jgi:hypothetical protein